MKYWSKEVKEKAREMTQQGMSRSQVSIALNVPVGTLSKWVRRLGRQPITYGEDKRKEAWDMYNKGMSRPQIAAKMRINIKTISSWLPPSSLPWFRHYPPEAKKKARSMSKAGIGKMEISARLKVNYGTVCRWTNDLTNRHSHVNGRYFLILAKLAGDGYFISNRNDTNMFRFLKRHVKIKSVLIGRLAVFYLPGNERKAFFGLVNREEIKGLGERKINLLKSAFNVK